MRYKVYGIDEQFDMLTPGVLVTEEIVAPQANQTSTVNVIGIVGVGTRGIAGETVESRDGRALARYFGLDSDLGKHINAISQCANHRFVAMRVVSDDAVSALATKEAGTDTTWKFTFVAPGEYYNDAELVISDGSIADTVTLTFTLNDLKYVLSNVDNDEDSPNFIGKKWAYSPITFLKTGTAVTLPVSSETAVTFASGDDGAAPTDGNLEEAAVPVLQSGVTDFVFAKDTSSALTASMDDLCTEFPNVFFYRSIEADYSEDLDDVVTEMEDRANPRVVSCAYPVDYYNPVTGEFEELPPHVWAVGVFAIHSFRSSPLRKRINLKIIQNLQKGDTDILSSYHVCYPIKLNGSWVVGEAVTETRDTYLSSLMVRRSYDYLEQFLAGRLERLIGFGGDADDKLSTASTVLTMATQYLQENRVIDEGRFSLSRNTYQSLMTGVLYVSYFVRKMLETRWVRLDVKLDSTGIEINIGG
jgi:hypothetical protein